MTISPGDSYKCMIPVGICRCKIESPIAICEARGSIPGMLEVSLVVCPIFRNDNKAKEWEG